jgi:sulfatase maturation enzyme AslB (radical SAM superfamily)
MSTQSNYCALPFRGMQIDCDGEIKPCCVYKPHVDSSITQYHISNYDQWHANSLGAIQTHVINNTVDPGCSSCLSPTALPHPMRTFANNFFKQTTQASATPEWLDIRFGNFCNLKCMMCTPDSSSQIEQEYNNNNRAYNALDIKYHADWKKFDINHNWWDDRQTFDRVVAIVNRARYVNFSGGEPLIVPQLFDLLDAIDPSCIVTFNTNLTRVTDRALTALSKLKHVTLQVSLDGIGAHQEYIRWNSKWPELDRNICTVLALPNVNVIFSYLLQHTSVYTWPALWNYLVPFGRKISIMPVYEDTISPGLLTLESVSPVDVEKFTQWLESNPQAQDPAIMHWLSGYQYKMATHHRFRDYVAMLDSIRGGDFVATFDPAWSNDYSGAIGLPRLSA